MKVLSDKVKSELAEINKAREAIGVKLLKIRVIRCLLCLQEFETFNRRTCGCDSDSHLKRLEEKFNARGR
jgi:phosphopantetheine adenylyltransferase